MFICASACASAPTVDHKTAADEPVGYEGDAQATPALEVLPRGGLSVDLTREMRKARELSAESLGLKDPAKPQGRTAREIQAWSESTLAKWLEHKHAAAEAARKQLDVAAEQNHEQRIMAGALVGLVYEDVARVLIDLPMPSDLDSEPEIAALYRELLTKQALPYVVQARLAYKACNGNAVQLAEMKHWAAFCEQRGERLPSVGEEQPANPKPQASL